MPEFEFRWQRFGGDGNLRILGISTGDTKWWLEFVAEESEITFPLLIMPRSSDVYAEYEIEEKDTWLLVLDDQGVIRFKDSGVDLDYPAGFAAIMDLLAQEETPPEEPSKPGESAPQ